MGRHSTKVVSELEPLSQTSGSLKRKREDAENLDQPIEVDVGAPEPLSKKAQRKARKAGQSTSVSVNHGSSSKEALGAVDGQLAPPQNEESKDDSKRTAFGIWIGNLPWSTNKPALIDFFNHDNQISQEAISRVHMPAPSKAAKAANEHVAAARNKGFAYIDFADQKSLDTALTLSNTFLGERRVLIKKSSDFDGRPDPNAQAVNRTQPGHQPNNKVWIGNLGFDVTREDLETHFSQCGRISHLQIATFQESGRCKGYAWLEFEALEAAEAAVKGYIFKNQDEEDESQEDAESRRLKKSKTERPRKWWVNKLFGRVLQVQFAESESVRYKKRFGNPQQSAESVGTDTTTEVTNRSSRRRPDFEHPSGQKRNPLRNIDVSNKGSSSRVSAAAVVPSTFTEGRGKKTILG